LLNLSLLNAKFLATEILTANQNIFIKNVIGSVSHAEALATCLTEADYRGHYCEGLNQLGEILFEKKLSKKHFLAETYIDEIREGGCNKDAVPHILKETPVTAWVDGNNGLGVVVGNFCMNLAIKKAKASGIGWVVAKGEDKISPSC
jgi:LDH2 family malate/lactate/ureidoglycolate dehydrogenase